MTDAIIVGEVGSMKVDSRGIDVAEIKRQEQRANELNGPVTVRKMTSEERIKYGLAPRVTK